MDRWSRTPGSAYAMLAVLVLATIGAYLDRQVISLLVDGIRRDLAVSDTQISILQGPAFSLLYGLAGMFLAAVADRGNRRTMLAAGVAFWSVMTVGCAMADSFGQLVLARVGMGIAQGCLLPICYSLIPDLFAADKRGRASGTITAAAGLGTGCAMVIGGLLLEMGDGPVSNALFGTLAAWRRVFLIAGVAGFPVASLAMAMAEPPRRAASPHQAQVRSTGGSWADFFRDIGVRRKAVGTLLVAGVGVAFIAMAVISWSSALLTRRFGLAPATTGFALGVAMMAATVIAPPIGGTATDLIIKAGWRGGRLILFAIFSPVILLGIGLLCFCPSPSFGYAGVFLILFGSSAITSIIYVAASELCAIEFRGRMVSLAVLTNNTIGVTLAPISIALLADAVPGMTLSRSLWIVSVPILFVSCLAAAMNVRTMREAELATGS